MIEFNGLKIDTRSLVLIAVTIVAVVALWPEGDPQPDSPKPEQADKRSYRDYSEHQSPPKQGRTAQTETQAPWQRQLTPYRPEGYGESRGYPQSATPSQGGYGQPQSGGYNQPGGYSQPQSGGYNQPGGYGNQAYRQPAFRGETPGGSQGNPYGYGGQGASPYGYTPYTGPRFRPQEEPKKRRGQQPGTLYSPVTPGAPDLQTPAPAYSPLETLPWEYTPYDRVPYDVAPSGSVNELDHLYTIR